MNRYAAILVFMISFDAQAIGPFGLEFGVKMESLRQVLPLEKWGNRFLFRTTTPPIPHDSFESYLLLVTPEHGLCSITGVSRSFSSSSDNAEIQREFENLERQLMRKYGEPLGVQGGEPASASSYTFNLNRVVSWTDYFKPLRDRISSITLRTSTLASNVVRVEVSYGDKNSFICALTAMSKSNDGL